MSQVFAFPDVVSIMSTFPPATPTAEDPSVLLSIDDGHLLQSSKVADRFSKLFNESDTRLELATLPAVLGTKHVDWVLHSTSHLILYSAERKAIVSRPETDRLVSDLRSAAQQQILYLSAFATEHDVDVQSLRSELEKHADLQVLEDPTSKSHRTWVSANTLLDSTHARIEDLLRNAGSDHKLDLSTNLPGVPRFIIQRYAEQLSHEKAIPGTVRLGKTRITFLSQAYEHRIQAERAKKVAREFSKILVQMHRSGYHAVPEDSEDAPGLQKVFFDRTKAGVDDGSFSMLTSQGKPIAVAFTNRLEGVLVELKSAASVRCMEDWKSKGTGQATTALDQSRIQHLVDASSSPDFAKLILEDARYRLAVEQSTATVLQGLESENVERSNNAFNESIRTPIRLYLVGINSVQDASLRQRLEDFVLEFLRKDLVPNGVQLLSDSKQRNSPYTKELERFSQACTDAKTLADVQSAVSKFVRKQKLESIPDADEYIIKKNILQQKVKSLRKMVRASDILQNLIWLLLAKELDGVFISSGRDTTRMIRFYQGLGDAEKTKRLEAWRDKFKEGQETREDIENMRSMADDVIGQMASTQNAAHEQNKQ